MVAAGSVVNTDVAPYTVVGGAPDARSRRSPSVRREPADLGRRARAAAGRTGPGRAATRAELCAPHEQLAEPDLNPRFAAICSTSKTLPWRGGRRTRAAPALKVQRAAQDETAGVHRPGSRASRHGRPWSSGRRFSSNNGSMIVRCWSVRSMPVRYDGSTGPTLIGGTLMNATPSVFHRRHIGRVLRSSCNTRGRRVASSGGAKPAIYATERGSRPLIGVARIVSQSTPQCSSRRSR